MLAYIPLLLSCAALLLTAYFAFRKEGKEEKQAQVLRLEKIDAEMAAQKIELANQKIRQQGFQAEIESVADYGKRERAGIMENVKRDFDALREQIKDVPTMQRLVYQMVERLDNTKESMAKLDSKMDRIVELLTHK